MYTILICPDCIMKKSYHINSAKSGLNVVVVFCFV